MAKFFNQKLNFYIYLSLCNYAFIYQVPGTTRTESTVYKCCFTSADIKKLTECETAFIMLDVVSVFLKMLDSYLGLHILTSQYVF